MSTLVAFLLSWLVVGFFVGWVTGKAAKLGHDKDEC